MPKIGIMSMQRVANYGSFLQAFALKGMLEEMGHSVEFVDYCTTDGMNAPSNTLQPRTWKDRGKIFFADHMKTLARYHTKIRLKCNGIQCDDLFHRRFTEEFIPMLGISSQRNEHAEVDTLVIGSDEVFNIMHNSMELFGEYHQAKRLISFAASFGNTDFHHIVEAGLVGPLRERFSNFDAISVRDKNSVEIIEKLSDGTITPNCHLDPVFHFDYSSYIPKIKVRQKYIAIYAYSNIPKKIQTAIRDFAEIRHLDILCLQGYQGELGTFMNINPFEVLAYIKNADFLVTTTFHGCVIGAKYNKQMAVYVTKRDHEAYNNESKLGDLVTKLGLSDHVFTDGNDLADTLNNPIDYKKVNSIISKEAKRGWEYLAESVRG